MNLCKIHQNYVKHKIMMNVSQRDIDTLKIQSCEKCDASFKTNRPFALLGGVVRYLCRSCAHKKAKRVYDKQQRKINPFEYNGQNDPNEPNYWLNDFLIFAKVSFYALITTFITYLFLKIYPRKIPTSPLFDFVYTIFTFFGCTLLFMWNEYDEASKSKQKTRKDI